jgi:hypothetical protein
MVLPTFTTSEPIVSSFCPKESWKTTKATLARIILKLKFICLIVMFLWYCSIINLCTLQYLLFLNFIFSSFITKLSTPLCYKLLYHHHTYNYCSNIAIKINLRRTTYTISLMIYQINCLVHDISTKGFLTSTSTSCGSIFNNLIVLDTQHSSM